MRLSWKFNLLFLDFLYVAQCYKMMESMQQIIESKIMSNKKPLILLFLIIIYIFIDWILQFGKTFVFFNFELICLIKNNLILNNDESFFFQTDLFFEFLLFINYNNLRSVQLIGKYNLSWFLQLLPKPINFMYGTHQTYCTCLRINLLKYSKKNIWKELQIKSNKIYALHATSLWYINYCVSTIYAL